MTHSNALHRALAVHSNLYQESAVIHQAAIGGIQAPNDVVLARDDLLGEAVHGLTKKVHNAYSSFAIFA